MNKKIATIDYDNCFKYQVVQDFVKELLSDGWKIFILTRRFDELNKHRFPSAPTNEDLYEVVTAFGIPRENIIFTNSELKGRYLSNTKVSIHVDDSNCELDSIVRYSPHVTAIKVYTDVDPVLGFYLLRNQISYDLQTLIYYNPSWDVEKGKWILKERYL